MTHSDVLRLFMFSQRMLTQPFCAYFKATIQRGLFMFI